MHFQVVEITLDVALAPIAFYLKIFTVQTLGGFICTSPSWFLLTNSISQSC